MSIPKAKNSLRIIGFTSGDYTLYFCTESIRIGTAQIVAWFEPPLSRYPGLYQVCSGFVPGGINLPKD